MYMTIKKHSKILTIIVGGDMDKDLDELLTNPEKVAKQPENAFYVDTYAQLHELLSPSKIDLLRAIMTYDPRQEPDVGNIAKKTKRKQEAVSRDLHALQKKKLIKLTKKGKHVLASTPFESIQIQFAQKA